MKTCLIMLVPAVCLAFGLAAAAHAAGQDKPNPQAGWLGVFPEMAGYQRTFLAPVVDAGAKPAAYRQTARYEWTGGAIKMLEVTLARDPAFKQKHAADALRKEKPAPKQIKVGKHTGWLWELAPEGGGKADQVTGRLIVPLGEDKALILVAKGPGPWEPLTDIAGRFDPAKIEAALAQPPRTAFLRGIDEFRALQKGISSGDILAWLDGPSKAVPGNATHVWIYDLADGSQVTLKLDCDPQRSLREAVYQRKDGPAEELLK